MPLYESIYIARQDISGQQVEGLNEAFGKIIEDSGGSVAKTEYWGLRSLAYKIKKNRKGHYVLMHIDAPVGAVEEMERNMRINEDVIRFMSLRMDKLDDGPSVMMQTKSARDGHRRDRDWDRREPRGETSATPATTDAKPATTDATPAASEPVSQEAAGENTAPQGDA